MPQSKIPVCKLDLYRQLNIPLPNVPSTPSQAKGPVRCKRAMGGDEGPICKRDIFKQMGLPVPGEEGAMEDMEMMVASMEQEMRTMQTELGTVQAERRQLEMQKRLLRCAAPTIGKSSGKQVDLLPIPTKSSQVAEEVEQSTQVSKPRLIEKTYDGEEAELKDLEEEYEKLLKDYNAKVEEVSMLRVQLENARRQSTASERKSEQAEARAEDLEARLRDFEEESIQATGNKDRVIELTQQLAMAERMFDKSLDEHEELQRAVVSQTLETDEFRRKYLNAEELTEEQRHRVEMLDAERIKLGEQVTFELQKIKAQFQSKLEEMTLLPDLINKTKEKLEETEELKTIAEKNCVIVSMSLDEAREEKDALQCMLDEVNRNRSESEAERSSIKSFLTDGEKKMEETKTENKTLKLTVARMEETAVINGRKYEEAVQDGKSLQEQLETLRQQSARQVSKTKDRFNKTRHTLQDQMAALEKELASSRAVQKTAMKDRDQIRQKMQAKILQLNENFEEAQSRIRSIQSHINYLKVSYTNTLL